MLYMISVITFVAITQSSLVSSQKHQARHVVYPSPYLPNLCYIKNTGESGICKAFDTCITAQYDWLYRSIQPTTCYYDRFQPIVCCTLMMDNTRRPTTTIVPPINTINTPLTTVTPLTRDNTRIQRRSDKICDDYYVLPEPSEGDFFITVVGGELAEKGEFPFMAAIGWNNIFNETEFNCGGFLISPNYVLTAAHCSNLGGAQPTIVRIGDDGLNTTNDYDYDTNINSSEDIIIETIFVHPNYNSQQTYNDIAIIKLKSNSSIKPACLWQTNNIDQYSEADAIGYGHTQFAGARSNYLMKVTLNLIENFECNKSYPPEEKFPRGIINTQLCAGDSTGVKDTCQGDSGGPIVIKNVNNTPYAIGITSFGSGCATGIPSVYTRISSYLDWIESLVWP